MISVEELLREQKQRAFGHGVPEIDRHHMHDLPLWLAAFVVAKILRDSIMITGCDKPEYVEHQSNLTI